MPLIKLEISIMPFISKTLVSIGEVDAASPLRETDAVLPSINTLTVVFRELSGSADQENVKEEVNGVTSSAGN